MLKHQRFDTQHTTRVHEASVSNDSMSIDGGVSRQIGLLNLNFASHERSYLTQSVQPIEKVAMV